MGGEYKQMCRSMSICMLCVISMLIYMFLCDCGVGSSQKELKNRDLQCVEWNKYNLCYFTQINSRKITKLVNMNIYGLKTHFWAQNAKNIKLKGPKRQNTNSEGWDESKQFQKCIFWKFTLLKD